MNWHVTTTSRLPKRFSLARAMVALLAVSAFAFAPHAQATPAPHKSGHASTKIILQHHTRAQGPAHGKGSAKSKIILQHHVRTH
jgi:hypothetical protein